MKIVFLKIDADNGSLTTEDVSLLENVQDAEVCTPVYNVNIPEVSWDNVLH